MKIEFDSASHTYTVDGVAWPGVTTILKPIAGNLNMVPPYVMERARQFGQAVHKTIELFVTDDLDEASLAPPLVRVLDQFKQAVAEYRWEIQASETIVMHSKYRYCGTADLFVTAPNRGQHRRILIDIKTGLLGYAGAQTAAYAEAHQSQWGRDNRLLHRAALMLTENTHKLIALDEPNDFNLFLSCLNIYRHLENHNGSSHH